MILYAPQGRKRSRARAKTAFELLIEVQIVRLFVITLEILAIAEWFYKMERYGMIIVLVVLITPIHIYLLLMPVQFILQFLLT